MSEEKILIVDDEPEIVELIRLYLEKEGYEVISTNNGTHALELMREHRPDLVILDILLPEMDGIEVCRRYVRPTIHPFYSSAASMRIWISFWDSASAETITSRSPSARDSSSPA